MKENTHEVINTFDAKNHQSSETHEALAGPGERVEKKERKIDLTYLLTYLHTNTNTNTNTSIDFEPKQRYNFMLEPSLHRAAKIIAPMFDTTISNMISDGLVKQLEVLIPQLPENVQLSIIHQLPLPKDDEDIPDEMLELEVDMAKERLLHLTDSMRKVKIDQVNRKKWLIEQLAKELNRSIRIARRSRDADFQKLVVDARELLRGSLL